MAEGTTKMMIHALERADVLASRKQAVGEVTVRDAVSSQLQAASIEVKFPLNQGETSRYFSRQLWGTVLGRRGSQNRELEDNVE